MRLCLMALVLFLLAGRTLAEPAPSDQLALDILQMTGTAMVFESEAVQKALKDPQPFLSDADGLRLRRLLADAGLRDWHAPRVWILAQGPGTASWHSAAADFAEAAARRGIALADLQPLPAAVEAIGFLRAGQAHPGLPALLAAYEADALLLLRGSEWSLWLPGSAHQGRLPATMGRPAQLLGIVAELSAAEQQWPRAHGRPVLRVDGVKGLADLAAVQSALLSVPGMQQLQLLRVDGDRLWFAWAAPDMATFSDALQADVRLPLRPLTLPEGWRELSDHCRLWCGLQARRWRPELAKPPLPTASPLQSPPSS